MHSQFESLSAALDSCKMALTDVAMKTFRLLQTVRLPSKVRALTTFSLLWYTGNGTVYTLGAPVAIQD